eukprot:5660098-Pyramimonas_sp.AAC.1
MGQRTARKLRTMAEALAKCTGGAVIQQDYNWVVRKVQPKQLGRGAPDARALMVDFARAAAEAI